MAGVRATEPGSFNPYGNGRFSIIPRRGVDRSLYQGTNGIYGCGYDSPLRLLQLLPDISPAVGLALWNALRLACAPGDLQIVAMTTVKGREELDEEGTSHIQALWDSLPSEIGGLVGLQTQLTQEAFLTGLICLEAVPGARGQGVNRVWPVNSLSVGFKRDSDTLEIRPMQRQMFPSGETTLGYVPLSTDTFYWAAIDSMVDEPYGRAPYAPAVAEVLADMAMYQDLRDAVHNAAWPRLGQAFNFTEMYKVATEQFALTEPDASEWVDARFQEIVTQAASLKADDNLFYDSNGDMKVIEGGSAFQALKPILEVLRQRITQSLKSLPTLMGINDGSTQTYTTVEWAIYAAGLESIRHICAELIAKSANLHLRLLGLPLKAVAKLKPIRTSDALVDANTEATQISNAKERIRLGWTSNEEESIKHTGTGPVADPMLGALDSNQASPPPQDPNQEPGPNTKPPSKPADNADDTTDKNG